jgi:hypothetical protein
MRAKVHIASARRRPKTAISAGIERSICTGDARQCPGEAQIAAPLPSSVIQT